jgi:hypothetical protein
MLGFVDNLKCSEPDLIIKTAKAQSGAVHSTRTVLCTCWTHNVNMNCEKNVFSLWSISSLICSQNSASFSFSSFKPRSTRSSNRAKTSLRGADTRDLQAKLIPSNLTHSMYWLISLPSHNVKMKRVTACVHYSRGVTFWSRHVSSLLAGKVAFTPPRSNQPRILRPCTEHSDKNVVEPQVWGNLDNQ